MGDQAELMLQTNPLLELSNILRTGFPRGVQGSVLVQRGLGGRKYVQDVGRLMETRDPPRST